MLSNNSPLKYIKNFKKIVRIAISNGWITKDPFFNYRGKLREIEKPYLARDELFSIQEKEFKVDRLNYVKDVFVFCCYTGLAYVDASKLRSTHIVKGKNNEDWIVIERTKTHVSCRIPLLPQAKELITKYVNHPLRLSKGTVLPILSNQKMNAFLKEIADVCGIEKNFTFHTARHTFATTVTLLNNVSLESVSKMFGHTNTIITQKYARIVDEKLSDDTAHLRRMVE